METGTNYSTRVLSVAALVVTALVLAAAVLAAGYEHEGSSPTGLVGGLAQLGLAGGGLALAVLAHLRLNAGAVRPAAWLATAGLAAAAAWWPVLLAFWD
jgi:hypothetical protein